VLAGTELQSVNENGIEDGIKDSVELCPCLLNWAKGEKQSNRYDNVEPVRIHGEASWRLSAW
jgi:hypothetical protein